MQHYAVWIPFLQTFKKKKTSKRTSIRKFTFVNLPKYWSRCCEGKVPLRHSKADIKLPHSQAIQFVQFGAIRSTIKLSFHLVVSLAMCTPLLCLQVEVNLGQLCHYQAQVALTPPQFVLQKNKKNREKERKKEKKRGNSGVIHKLSPFRFSVIYMYTDLEFYRVTADVCQSLLLSASILQIT